MMKMKKTLSLFLALITIMTFMIVPVGAVSGIETLTFNGFEDSRFSVSWWKSELNGKYYAFLPADADLSQLTVTYKASADVYVSDKKLVSGKKTDAFKNQGEYSLTCGTAKYTLLVMKSANIPAMYIETESGSLDYIHADKSNKEKGKIAVMQDGKVILDTELSSIKGRGNSSWGWAKKPYNIKFDKKTDLFGMGKAKKWSLIASYKDPALIRNKVICDFADELGLKYSSKSQHVDLYVNGEYLGNYLVMESVEVGSTRVDINDLDDANEEANEGIDIEELPQMYDFEKAIGSMRWVDIPNNPKDITGGYLIEMDVFVRYKTEVSGFISDKGQPCVIKSPEYASKAEVEYISDFYQKLEDAVFSETGYNSLGRHYSDYIDLESFAKMYLLEEFTMDVDAGITSAYFYKEAGENSKLVASPVWDFDSALGRKLSRGGVSISKPDIWYALVSHYEASETVTEQPLDTIFTALLKHDDFFELVCKEWNKNFKPLMEEYQKKAKTLVTELNASALMDSARWARDDKLNTIEKCQNYYNEEVKIVTDFMEKRLVVLDKGFSENSARLYFDVNGGTGNHNNYIVATIGETVKLESAVNLEAPEGTILMSWNTEKDGSGTSYSVLDEVTLEKGKTVLYAQYGESKLLSGLTKLIERLRTFIQKIVNLIKNLLNRGQSVLAF